MWYYDIVDDRYGLYIGMQSRDDSVVEFVIVNWFGTSLSSLGWPFNGVLWLTTLAGFGGETWVEFASELLEFFKIHIGDWSSGGSQSLFEVLSGNFWDWIEVLSFSSFFNQDFHSGFSFNGISNSWFSGFLADLSQVSTWESIGNISQEVKINILGNWSLSKVSLKDTQAWWLIRQGNIDKLIESSLKIN